MTTTPDVGEGGDDGDDDEAEGSSESITRRLPAETLLLACHVPPRGRASKLSGALFAAPFAEIFP